VAQVVPFVAVAAVLQLAHRSGDVVSSEAPDAVLAPPAAARAIASESPGPARYYANTTGLPPTGSPAEAVRLDRELLLAATGELYGLGNVNTPSSLNLVAHEILMKALSSASRDGALDALAALGTGYVTTWVPLEGAPIAREISLAAAGPGPRLYALPAQARAFFARRIVRAGDALGAVGHFVLTSPGWHAGLAVLEADAEDVTPAGHPLADAAEPAAETPAGTIRWVEDGASHLVLDVDLARPALLVVNDTWLQGWSATVNELPAQILRVNGVVRGLALDAGKHRIAMWYRPPGLREGLLISIASGLAVALLVAVGRRRRVAGPVAAAARPRPPLAEPQPQPLKARITSRQRSTRSPARKGT
jgi:hypothetical protein